jgi:hypothetical protein
MSNSVETRSYFSGQHIAAAALCARNSRDVEFANAGHHIYVADHFSFVMGSVLFSVASLEAAINELFADAAESNLARLRPLDEGVVRRMGMMWLSGVPRTARFAVLDKYAIALALADQTPFDKGAEPWQSAAKLVKLRNALVHYEPEWVLANPATASDAHSFERDLSGRFDLNPLAAPENPFYPDKLLGYGCAAWSARSAMNFMDEFCRRLALLARPYGNRDSHELAL